MKDQDTWILGAKHTPLKADFSDQIAFDDHKIAFCVKYCKDKDVLDLGCVQHNPENYRSKYWLHKALAAVAKSVEGVDIYDAGVMDIQRRGYNVTVGDVQKLRLGRQFDVIVAGDLIEHLTNLGDFIEGCRAHLRPAGKLLISTPNPWYWKNVVKAMLFSAVANNPEHTLWLCPITLGQLLARYNMKIVETKFGSRYLADKLMPLPAGLRHAGFHVAVMANQ